MYVKDTKKILKDLKKNPYFFPFFANLKKWWKSKDIETVFRGKSHLGLREGIIETLEELGFDVKANKDITLASLGVKGLPRKLRDKVLIEGEKTVGGKKFKVLFFMRAPSKYDFFYVREFYINGKKVEGNEFFEELLDKDPQTRNLVIEKIQRKKKEIKFNFDKDEEDEEIEELVKKIFEKKLR